MLSLWRTLRLIRRPPSLSLLTKISWDLVSYFVLNMIFGAPLWMLMLVGLASSLNLQTFRYGVFPVLDLLAIFKLNWLYHFSDLLLISFGFANLMIVIDCVNMAYILEFLASIYVLVVTLTRSHFGHYETPKANSNFRNYPCMWDSVFRERVCKNVRIGSVWRTENNLDVHNFLQGFSLHHWYAVEVNQCVVVGVQVEYGICCLSFW